MKLIFIFIFIFILSCDDSNEPITDCHENATNWPSEWTALEKEVLSLVNLQRADGESCTLASGEEITHPPKDPLVLDSALHCAARVHSLWMSENGTLSHESPGGPLGDTVRDRFANAGYEGRGWAENIASGQQTPEAVVQSWMSSTAGHCTSIMGDYTMLGVGYAIDESASRARPYWTLTFGR